MISRIHSKLGTAGLVVAIVALVAALTGAAFAAGGGLTSTQKKEVKKIAKKYAGKPGAQGPIGPQGAPGKDGANGANGADGTDGANGKSVVLTAEAAGANCKAGGTKVEVEGNAASKKYVCNGQTGFTATLPSGATETGVWATGTNDGASIIPLSFNIPLATAPEFLRYVTEAGLERYLAPGPEIKEVTPEHCLGTAEEPKAEAGYVCVYALEEEGTFSVTAAFRKLLKTGATFFFSTEAGKHSIGTWAVTAK